MESGVRKITDPSLDSGGPVLLFDGVCNLCNGAVAFIIRRDRRRLFRFASLQSTTARRLLGPHGFDPARLDSFVLIDGDRCLTRSDAVLAIARRLGPPWSFLGVFGIVPRRLRDALYGVVANNRYSWFGRKKECPVPSADVRDRFLPDS